MIAVTFDCPRCGGAVRCTSEPMTDPVGMSISMLPLDARRHSACFGGPNGGQPLPVAA